MSRNILRLKEKKFLSSLVKNKDEKKREKKLLKMKFSGCFVFLFFPPLFRGGLKIMSMVDFLKGKLIAKIE